MQQLARPSIRENRRRLVPLEQARGCQSKRLGGRDYMLLAGLAGLALFLCCYRMGETELFVNNDETRHAFTGVFLRDSIVDFPVTHPREYAENYYARYPAVSIFRWPPFFHCVEAVFFLLLGISVATAKICVAGFALLFIVYFYRVARDHFGAWIAAGATLLAVTAPQVIYYSRAVMLEIPTLALCTAAIFYFARALGDDEDRRAKYLCSLFMALAFLTKQNAFFLLLVFASYALFSGNVRRLMRRSWLLPLALVVLVTAPYYIAAMQVYGDTLMKDAVGAGQLQRGSAEHWLWYYFTVPKQLGSMTDYDSPPAQIIGHLAILATIVVAIWAVARRKGQRHLLYLCWIFSCYVFFAPMAQTDSRHMILWVPPLCVMSVLAIRWLAGNLALIARIRGMRPAFASAAIFAICIYTAYGTLSNRPYVRGYEQAAKYVVETEKRGAVFFKGYLNGNFIFFLRMHDQGRGLAVSNASHDLFSTKTMSKYGLEEHVASMGQLDELLKNRGVKRLVIEEPDIFDDSERIGALSVLRNFLASDKCKLEKEFQVESNVPRYRGVTLKVYEFLGGE